MKTKMITPAAMLVAILFNLKPVFADELADTKEAIRLIALENVHLKAELEAVMSATPAAPASPPAAPAPVGDSAPVAEVASPTPAVAVATPAPVAPTPAVITSTSSPWQTLPPERIATTGSPMPYPAPFETPWLSWERCQNCVSITASGNGWLVIDASRVTAQPGFTSAEPVVLGPAGSRVNSQVYFPAIWGETVNIGRACESTVGDLYLTTNGPRRFEVTWYPTRLYEGMFVGDGDVDVFHNCR